MTDTDQPQTTNPLTPEQVLDVVRQAREAIAKVMPDTAPAGLWNGLAMLDDVLVGHHDDSPRTIGLYGEDGVTSRLTKAFGIDPETHAGFELTVQGGEWPVIRPYRLLDVDEGRPIEAPVSRAEALGAAMMLVPVDSAVGRFVAMASERSLVTFVGTVVISGRGTDSESAFIEPDDDDRPGLREGARVLIVQTADRDEATEAPEPTPNAQPPM